MCIRDRVIGTTFKYKFIDSNNSISRTPEIEIFNDKMSKPVAIQEHIGQRPVFACGNEGGGGDIYMLKYSQGNKYPSFQMIINHDDSTREFYYHEKDSASLKAAAKYKWHVVSMKNDWREIFAKEWFGVYGLQFSVFRFPFTVSVYSLQFTGGIFRLEAAIVDLCQYPAS